MNIYERKALLDRIEDARAALAAYRDASHELETLLNSRVCAGLAGSKLRVAHETLVDGERGEGDGAGLSGMQSCLDTMAHIAERDFAARGSWAHSGETVRGIPVPDATLAQAEALECAYQYALAAQAIAGDSRRGHVCTVAQSSGRTMEARRTWATRAVWNAENGGLTLAFPRSSCRSAALDAWARDAADQILTFAASRGIDAYAGKLVRKSA